MKKLLKSVVTVALAAMMAVSVVPQNTQAAEPEETPTIFRGTITGIDYDHPYLEVDDEEPEDKSLWEYIIRGGNEVPEANGEWELDVASQTIYVRGPGKYLSTFNCFEFEDDVLYEYFNKVRNVIIEEGVLQAPCLGVFEHVKYVKFPSTLMTIPDNMMGGVHIENMYIPKSVKYTDTDRIYPFGGKESTVDHIYYEGSEEEFFNIKCPDGSWGTIKKNDNYESIMARMAESNICLPKHTDTFTIEYNVKEDPTRPAEPDEPDPELDPELIGQTYTITYEFNGGTPTEDFECVTSYEYGQEIESVVPHGTVERKGYIKEGWYTDSALTQKFDGIHPWTSGDITLYVKWKAASYTIYYNLNKGKFKKSQEVIKEDSIVYSLYTIESNDVILPKPTRKGYKFKGWYMDKNFAKSSKITKIDAGSTDDVFIYAKWKKK